MAKLGIIESLRLRRAAITPVRRTLNMMKHCYVTGTESQTPLALAEEIISRIDVDWSNPHLKFLDVKSNLGTFSILLAEKLLANGHSIDHILDNMIYSIDSERKYCIISTGALDTAFDRTGNVICGDFLTHDFNMKFDVIVGNPPYGKNSNLAIKFLNKCADLSDNIHLVLPKTVRKASYMNRIVSNLRLVSDIDNSDSTFGGGIITCTQNWVVSSEKRDKIKRFSTHPDFEFVNKFDADIMIGRVGAGPCAKIKTENFLHYKDDHYFLKVKNEEVIIKLQKLYPVLRKASCETVGMPCLSKHDLIKIYIENADLSQN